MFLRSLVVCLVCVQSISSTTLHKRDTSDNEVDGRIDLLSPFLTTTPPPTTPDTTTSTPLPARRRFSLPSPTPRPHPRTLLADRRREMTSAERLERAHRAFDRMVQFVNIVGQLDAYISDQAKLAVRKLNAMYAEEERFRKGY